MDYLTFTAEAEAIAAERQIWVNQLRGYAESSGLVGDGNQVYRDLDGFVDDAVANLKIYDTVSGIPRPDLHGTTKYAEIHKVWSQEKWVFPEPPDELMSGVLEFTREAIDLNWWAPPEPLELPPESQELPA